MTREQWTWLLALSCTVALWLGCGSAGSPEPDSTSAADPVVSAVPSEHEESPASSVTEPVVASSEQSGAARETSSVLMLDELTGTYVLDKRRHRTMASGDELEIQLDDGRMLSVLVCFITDEWLVTVDPDKADQVPDRYGPPMSNDVAGVVQAADHEAGEYVLSAGSRDGVEIGYEFTVHRGDEYVHTVIVHEVREDLSRSRGKRGMRKTAIRVGDKFSNHL